MRIEQLTFTRFIAAIAIIIFHFGKGIAPFDKGIVAAVFNNANVAVSYFFTLSGFVMIVAYGAGGKTINHKTYYVKRIAKLYPVYLLALLPMVFLADSVSPTKLLAELLLVQTTIPPLFSEYNLPGWSLSVEAFFYLIFPLVFNSFYRKYNAKTIAAVVLGFWFVSQVAFYSMSISAMGSFSDNLRHLLLYSPLVHYNEFFVGNLTGLIFIKLSQKGKLKSDMPLLVFFIVIALSGLLIPFMKTWGLKLPVNFHNGLLVVLFAPFILLLSLNNGRIAKVLSAPLLVLLGEISYCIYILQMPVYAGFTSLFQIKNAALNFYCFVPVLIAVSALVYYLVEIPAKAYLTKRFS